MEPKVRDFLTKLRKEAFLQIKDGYVDSGAAPGKDTRWQDVAQLKPHTTTKEEVAAHQEEEAAVAAFPAGYANKSLEEANTAPTPASQAAPILRSQPRLPGADRRSPPSTMKSPYVNELEPNQADHHQFPGSLQGNPPEEDRRAVPFPAAGRPHGRCGRQDVGQRRRGAGHLRARRFRQGQRSDPDLPQSAAAHHPQDPADGRQRNRFRATTSPPRAATRRRCGRSCAASWRGIANPHLQALLDALLDDEDIARRYRRAPAAKQIHHAYLGGLLEHVLSLCTLARADRRALSVHRLRPAAGGRGAARYRQDLRAELRARLLLFRRRATAGPHQHRPAHGGRQAARPAGFSAAAAHAGGAHDPEPPRTAGVRLAQAAAVPRSSAAALSGRHGFQDGVHAGADRKRPAGGRLLHHVQSPRWSARRSRRTGFWIRARPARAARPAGPDFAPNGGAPEASGRGAPAAATHPLFAAQAGFAVRR